MRGCIYAESALFFGRKLKGRRLKMRGVAVMMQGRIAFKENYLLRSFLCHHLLLHQLLRDGVKGIKLFH
ncbi:unnamed protein product [Coffea canephora]|uniref:Uncharacterized protein n=1 Tax=Coffea canephora TaxID=49390 RepID=A0A068UPI4_COFCA|nr:unnamed protein product [Coffea canephora]